MNVEANINPQSAAVPRLNAAHFDLYAQGFDALNPLAQMRDSLRNTLEELVKTGDKATVERARKLLAKLADVAPAVTMIGQVKAGKTSLVNAMIGTPGLLPSDVNPWTSVVTSLHLDPSMSSAQNRATFEFFDRTDWDRLVVGGGRIGELARRAGATSELERVTAQVAALQEKSRERLGSKFELLLGQSHEYGYFDQDLVERYVCLGDDFEDDTETSKSRGRFADITKSAEIFMHNPATPVKLCLRDTPGVNDTFLVREQITMKAIRGSQVCVVVLAAHQALSTVDFALLRMISNVKSRQVVIFVNRIDELADPATQVPEIRASITETLKAHQGPHDVSVIFGSAHWATHLLEDRLHELDQESAEALLNYSQVEFADPPANMSEQDMIWHMSGLPSLQNALAERVAEGAGRSALEAIARSVRNLLSGIMITTESTARDVPASSDADIDPASAKAAFAELEAQKMSMLEDGLNDLRATFAQRIDKVHDSFVDRATAALIEHLDSANNTAVWNYDPTGLRMLLRASYRTFAKRSKDTITRVFEKAAQDSANCMERVFAMIPDTYALDAPVAVDAPEPVILGKTIALDLQSNWWATWWKKQTGAKTQTEKFSELIAAETAPILEALRDDYAEAIRQAAHAQLEEFLAEQRQVLEGLLNSPEASDPLRASHKLTARIDVAERGLAQLDALFSKADE